MGKSQILSSFVEDMGAKWKMETLTQRQCRRWDMGANETFYDGNITYNRVGPSLLRRSDHFDSSCNHIPVRRFSFLHRNHVSITCSFRVQANRSQVHKCIEHA